MEKLREYFHGYSPKESDRLQDQANTLHEIIHFDSLFREGSTVLEAGCGVGSQTKIIASKNPSCQFYSVDISTESLEKARKETDKMGIKFASYSNPGWGF